MEAPDGRPARDAGAALTGITVAFLVPATAMAWSQIRAKKAPLVRICREGIEVRLIGRTTLDGVPGVPGLVRVVWAFLSRQGFRTCILRAPWDGFHGARVEGLPAMRVLIIDAAFTQAPGSAPCVGGTAVNQVVFNQVAFVKPLQDIVDAIRFYHEAARRPDLPGWPEAA